MAIAFVKSATGTTTGFPQAVTTTAFGTNTTTGNAMLVGIIVDAAINNVTSVTDNMSNTYTKMGSFFGTTYDVEIYYVTNMTGGASHTVTANYSSFTDASIIVFEVSGLASSSAFDKQVSATGTSGNLDSGNTATTAFNNEYIFAVGMVTSGGTTMTAGTGYANLIQNQTSFGTIAAEGKVVSATGAYNATMTSSITNQSWSMLVGTFSDGVGGGGGGGPTPANDPAMYLSRSSFQPSNLKPLITDY
jgi:hypothetical protein